MIKSLSSIIKFAINFIILLLTSAKLNLALATETLYIVHSSSYKLSAYSINQNTGALSDKDIGNFPDNATGSLDTGAWPGDITIANNKYIYVANFNQPTVSMFEIIKDKVHPLSVPDITVPPSPWSTRISPDGKNAYTGNFYSSNISNLAINQQTGLLETIESTPTTNAGSGVAGIGINPNAPSYAYAAYFQENRLEIFRRDSKTGALISTNRFVSTEGQPRGVWFDNHNHAYVMNYMSSSISMYNMNTITGDLTPLSPATITTGIMPTAINFSKDGRFAYIASLSDYNIYMYKIESTGVLTPLATDKIYSGAGPRSIAIDNNNHMFVCNMIEYTISIFNINPNTGILTKNPLDRITTKYLSPYIITIATDQ